MLHVWQISSMSPSFLKKCCAMEAGYNRDSELPCMNPTSKSYDWISSGRVLRRCVTSQQMRNLVAQTLTSLVGVWRFHPFFLNLYAALLFWQCCLYLYGATFQMHATTFLEMTKYCTSMLSWFCISATYVNAFKSRDKTKKRWKANPNAWIYCTRRSVSLFIFPLFVPYSFTRLDMAWMKSDLRCLACATVGLCSSSPCLLPL
jgi:hypothetical protein